MAYEREKEREREKEKKQGEKTKFSEREFNVVVTSLIFLARYRI